ncbi:MAG TPA: hypothetical protein VHG69_02635 [Thermoleophilaceae bacterium]|nr:hypothetical protein [Thermoleophilaceae bacterium]
MLAALAVAGCGTAERERDAAAVVERFHAALGQEDGPAACEELGEQTRSELESREQAPCEEAILTLDLPKGGRPVNARVYQTSAAVDLAEGGTDFLDESSQGWTISAAGCQPTAPEQPYDCELKG